MINVTKPFLAPQAEYEAYLSGIWQRGWLTNNGPLVNELEAELKNYLQLPHLHFLSNGTIALQIAIKALNLQGEILTTPFSYVATTSSIVWENCRAVFVDIDPETLNIDPNLLEQHIGPNTSAILATHVYGNPCDIDAIQKIADKHNLKVIYDAAHCFGSEYKGQSVFAFGDVSTCSFHATKLFHTIEGGALMSPSEEIAQRLGYMRNFGHDGPESFAEVGINGKNSEFHAAMGLVNLKHIARIRQSRLDQKAYYDKALKGLPLSQPKILAQAQPNYSYYPIIFESEEALLKTVKALNSHWIYPRRYFYPALNSLNYVDQQSCPLAEDISKRVLCLPMYVELSEAEMKLITNVIHKALK